MPAAVRTTLNYLGPLLETAPKDTPFLSMAGGLNGYRTALSDSFPLNQHWALAAASQNTVTENASIAQGTPGTTARGQDFNAIELHKLDFGSSWLKESTAAAISGVSIASASDGLVPSEFDLQKAIALKQLALDLEFSALNGTYVAAGTPGTAAGTRGAITACSTNVIAGGAVKLTVEKVNELVRAVRNNGPFSQMVIFVNAFQKQMMSDLYGYAPTSVNVGGVNIQNIYTDFGEVGIVYDPQVPASTLALFDMSFIQNVFLPYAGQAVAYQELSPVAAAKLGFFYAQYGIDYGIESYHGVITDLATS